MNLEKIIEKIKEKPDKATFLIVYGAKNKRELIRRMANRYLTKIARGVVATEDNDTAWVFADYVRGKREKVKVFFAFPLDIDELEKLGNKLDFEDLRLVSGK